MDRTWIAVFIFGLVLWPATGGTSAADRVGEKDLPYSIMAYQGVLSDVQAAVEYCNSLGASTGMLGDIIEEFSELDITQPIRFEMCLDPTTSSAVQLMAIAGDAKMLSRSFDFTLTVVPGHTDLFETSEGAFLCCENNRCYVAFGEEGLTAEVADKLLTRLKRDDKHNSRYQWSISSRPCEFNPPMRKMMLRQLTQATSVKLQQRDDENDVSYQLRSFLGKTKLAILNTLAADCEYVEAGFNVLPAEERGTMEFTFKARENSTLDRWMSRTVKARSPFAGMLQDEDRTAVSLSIELGETQKDTLKSLTAATATALVKSLDLPANTADAFAKMVSEQIKRGQAHAYLQMNRFHPASPFDSLSGGISLKNGDAMVPVLNHVMSIIARDDPAVRVGEADGDQSAIHFWNNPFDVSENATVAITANSNGIWFAFGEETGTRENYQVAVSDPGGNPPTRTAIRTRMVNVESPGARERLEDLIADVTALAAVART